MANPGETIEADDLRGGVVRRSVVEGREGSRERRGDYLAGLLVVPATTSPGAVSIKDGSGSAIPVFTGGATSVADLKPFPIPLGLVSLNGAWKVTTGANVSVIAIGNFT
jgi:hypothetical protein